MEEKDKITNNLEFCMNKCCASVSGSDTYEVSVGSLPDIQTGGNEFKEIYIENDTYGFVNSDKPNEFESEGKCAISIKSRTSSKLSDPVQNNDTLNLHNEKIKSSLKNDCKNFNKNSNLTAPFINTKDEFKNYANQEVCNLEIQDRGDKQDKSKDAEIKTHNNAIKIKFRFHGNRMKKVKKTPKIPDNYTLEIQLSNRKKILKLTNNKKIQVDSTIGRSDYESRAIENISLIKKVHLEKYCTSENGLASLEFEKASVSKNPKSTNQFQITAQNVERKAMFTKNFEKINKMSIYKQEQCNIDSILHVSEHNQKNEIVDNTKYNKPDSETKQGRHLTASRVDDKFVQTTENSNLEKGKLYEDQEMMKLEMWLEIINNSEYNNYNSDLYLASQSEKPKLTESRMDEHERNFQNFLKELGQSNCVSCSKIDQNMNVVHDRKVSQINNKLNLTDYDRDRSISVQHKRLLEKQLYFHNHLKQRTKSNHSPSFHSVDLTEYTNDYFRANQKDNNIYSNKIASKNKLANDTIDGWSLKKMIQSFITRVTPNENNDVKNDEGDTPLKEQSFYSYYSISEKSNNSFWTKLNPFKFCYLGNHKKPFFTALKKTKKSNTSMLDNKLHQVQCCYLPDKKDLNDYKTESESIINNYGYNNEGYSSYFSPSFPSNYSSSNYPYDRISFMHSAEGFCCCNPDLNQLQCPNRQYY